MNLDANRNAVTEHPFIHFYRFNDLRVHECDVVSCFKSSASSEESSNFIEHLSSVRRSMVLEIRAVGSSSASKLSCVEQYIPLVFRLMESLNNQPAVVLDRVLLFEWKGALTTERDPARFEEIIYDLIMSLHAKAFLHYRIANELLSSDISSINVANSHFLDAAGVMKFLHTSLLPRWPNRINKRNLPPECCEGICLMFDHYFTALAQILAVVKAMSKEGGTPPGLMVKLCQAVVHELESATSLLVRGIGPFGNKIDSNGLKLNFALLREVYQAYAYKYQAEVMMASCETGAAIAYCRKALVSFNHCFFVVPLYVHVSCASSHMM